MHPLNHLMIFQLGRFPQCGVVGKTRSTQDGGADNRYQPLDLRHFRMVRNKQPKTQPFNGDYFVGFCQVKNVPNPQIPWMFHGFSYLCVAFFDPANGNPHRLEKRDAHLPDSSTKIEPGPSFTPLEQNHGRKPPD